MSLSQPEAALTVSVCVVYVCGGGGYYTTCLLFVRSHCAGDLAIYKQCGLALPYTRVIGTELRSKGDGMVGDTFECPSSRSLPRVDAQGYR